MVNYFRSIASRVESWMFQQRVLIIYGPRQVGKTTLLKKLQTQYKDTHTTLYLNCDEINIRQALTDRTSRELKEYVGSANLLLVDEAQRVPNIGLTLKLLHDTYPDVQIIATGSSSFDLANKINEPLTGRKVEFRMYPLALTEIASGDQLTFVDVESILEKHMIYGMYPQVVTSPSEKVEETLQLITNSYLYKDLLSFNKIHKPEILEKLLQALALQIGNEVSYTEIANLIGIDKNTVESYVRLLEQSFIIFRLHPLHRNRRNELKKLRKVYFYDTGIRNALIRNFNPLDLRQDKGALFENFMIVERLKRNSFVDFDPLAYFWQTHQKKEIDYLEEYGGKFNAFEFKWKNKDCKAPREFTESYPDNTFKVVNSKNFWEFITTEK